eukprot:jgi/Botrbrau1/3225/Bobra.174_1s0002.1
MPKKGGIGKRGVGGNKKGSKAAKRAARRAFAVRHFDQVWEDIRREESVVTVDAEGRKGPVGTTSKALLDDDIPGQGRIYCVECSRYFGTAIALAEHQRSKPHKRRVKALKGPRPHNQRDAEAAAGMGPPDNGFSAPTPMEV